MRKSLDTYTSAYSFCLLILLYIFCLSSAAVSQAIEKREDVSFLQIRGILVTGSKENLVKKGQKSEPGIEIKACDLPGDKNELANALSLKFIGKPLSREVISEVRKEIITYFRKHDRPIVAVNIPEQDVTEGVLQLLVVEGTLGEIVCKGNRWFSDKFLSKSLHIKSGDPINSEKLFNDLAWINRSPYRRSDVIFSPGRKEGTTDIEIITQDRMPLRLFAGDDNTGNKATGRGRWFVGGNWGNFLNLDHTINYQFTGAYNLKRFYSHTVNYLAPLSWHHTLMVYGSFSKVHPHLQHFYSRGRSAQGNLRYQIPFKNIFQGYLNQLSCGFDYKWTNNNIEFTGGRAPEVVTKGPINLTQLNVSYNFGKNFKKDHLSFSTLVYYSPGKWLGHQSHDAYKKLNPGAYPDYVYSRFLFANEYFVPKILSLWTQMRIQLASKPLLPSEQFGLGGYDTVRGYEERVSNTDNALCLNFELRSRSFSPLRFLGSKIQDQITFLGFVDYGKGLNDAKALARAKNHWLLSVGPGIRYKLSSYATARFDLGFKLHQTQFSDEPWAKAHFGILASY